MNTPTRPSVSCLDSARSSSPPSRAYTNGLDGGAQGGFPLSVCKHIMQAVNTAETVTSLYFSY